MKSLTLAAVTIASAVLLLAGSAPSRATVLTRPDMLSRQNAPASAAAPVAPFADLSAIRHGMSPADRGTIAVQHARNIRDFGMLGRNKPVRVGLIMRYRNEAQLKSLTLAQGQRGSRYYHHYLSPKQFTEYFGADGATYARTIATLQRRGFRIVQTFANRSSIMAEAPAAVAEKYFQTELHQVYQPGLRDGVRYVNVRPGIVPAELKSSIVSVSGLSSIQTVTFPIHLAKQRPTYTAMRRASHTRGSRARVRNAASPAPTPIGTSTPSIKQPGPDPTEVPDDPITEYENYEAYGPPIFADAYDFPVQHGYGGSMNHAVGSVILDDFLDSDTDAELKTFNITRPVAIQHATRRCTDPNATAYCDGTINPGNPNPPGDPYVEATLDANAIMTLAPDAPFVEYIAPQFNDVSIEFAYEDVISDNAVDAVNSSFGGCETDDPDFEYSTNYIAMEGAALGITFNASTGDTGSTNCGQYAANGAPQTEVNTSIPSSDYYFTAVGGTDFMVLTSCSGIGDPTATSACYTHENVWTTSGGGSSVFEPIAPWQAQVADLQTATVDTSTTNRDTPDVVLVADPNPPGVGFVIYDNGGATGGGGTSLASPMFSAMQVEIDQVQGSRNGWINPAMYAIYYQQNACAGAVTCTAATSNPFAFRNLIGGANVTYACVFGYNNACGLGSPLGWELAGAPVYGTPGGMTTPAPIPSSPPTPIATAAPTPTPSPTPGMAVGTNYKVTTIAGSTSCAASTDGTGTKACFSGPAGITYVPSSATGVNTQSTTDNYVFVQDFGTGYLRALDTTTNVVTTENNTTFAQATDPGANVLGIQYFPTGAQATSNGLYLLSQGGTTASGFYSITLPTRKNATPTAGNIKALSGSPTAIAFNTTTGSEAAIVASKNTAVSCIMFQGATTLTFEGGFTSALPTMGNYGIAFYPTSTSNTGLPLYYVTSSTGNSVLTVSDLCAGEMGVATVTKLTSGAPLNLPKEITFVSGANGGTGAFFIANEGGNNIVRLLPGAATATVVAGYGAGSEVDGYNNAAAFNAPFGITTDGTNLFVTDSGGNTVREISAIP